MRWDQMCGDDARTASEEGNDRAVEHHRRRSWKGLIHMQRDRRIACEIEKAEARLIELHEIDPGRYYDGDWTEAYDALLAWRTRDPYDERQWIYSPPRSDLEEAA